MGDQRPYKRKKILINPHFQLRATALVVSVALAILAILGVLYVQALGEQRRILGATREVGGRAGEVEDREFAADLREKAWENEDRPRLALVFGVAAGLVVLLAYLAIRVTFRAAGPAYAVSRMLRALAMGQYREVRPLRNGDEFRFLGEDVIALRDQLRREAESDTDLLARAIETLGALPPPERAADQALRAELIAELKEAARIKNDRAGRVRGREEFETGGSASE